MAGEVVKIARELELGIKIVKRARQLRTYLSKLHFRELSIKI